MFVVAKANFYDNTFIQEIKDYPSLYVAYINEATYVDGLVEDDEQGISIEDIKQRYFDADRLIDIIEVHG